MWFRNNPTIDDWVVFCDLCGTPCKASQGGWKSAGINDNSLWLCKITCYDKYSVNPIYKYPTPAIRDKFSPPFVKAGVDNDFVLSNANQDPII